MFSQHILEYAKNAAAGDENKAHISHAAVVEAACHVGGLRYNSCAWSSKSMQSIN